MTPRRPGSANALSTSSALVGVTTVARLGAVRPQPVSSSSAGIDTDGEEHGPHQAQHLQGAVVEHDLLGGAALPQFEQQRVAEDAEHEGDDGQLEPKV